jgi:hypothetical protein
VKAANDCKDTYNGKLGLCVRNTHMRGEGSLEIRSLT